MSAFKNMKWGSLGLALLVLLALVLWMVSGDVKTARVDVDERRDSPEERLVRVQVDILKAQTYEPELVIQGQVEAWRKVMISTQLEGTVEALPVGQGQHVSAGEVLLRLSEDDRPAAMLQAKARVRQLEAELAATDRLRSDNLVSKSEKMRLESELATAQAALQQAGLATGYLAPKAPFDGIVNRRDVELGQYVQKGESLMELVQIDRLKVTGSAPQQSVARLKNGQPVTIDLLDGRTMQGRLSFVASAANQETRSFQVEAEVDNPDRLRLAGGSATLRIALPEEPAMFMSPAHLSLGNDGKLGIRHVDDDNVVRFTNVTLRSANTAGAWVTGLPPKVQLITRGGGFVSLGQRVEPVIQDDSGAEG